MAATPSPSRASRLGVVLRHHVPMALVGVASIAIVVGVAVIPLQTWLEQREQLAEIRSERDAVVGEVDELRVNLDRLRTDDEIERLGRQNFDLVFPGEESYRILPAPSD